MEEENKEYIYLSASLVKKLEACENKTELLENEVLIYIEKQKKDISSEVEMLDDDVLMFRAKIAKYKKEMKSAYVTGSEELYKFWEELDKKRKSFDNYTKESIKSLANVDTQIKNRFESIEKLYEKMKDFNIYHLEKIVGFLQMYDSLSDETKSILKILISKEGTRA